MDQNPRAGTAPADDDQREVIAFLRDPASYPPPGLPPPFPPWSGSQRGDAAAADEARPLEVVETHASLVFLVGGFAYKLKRAVRYPYLDFSTIERRRAACIAELELNRRTAPQLYLDVRAVRKLPGGALAWGSGSGGEAGEAVDFVVAMRRFEGHNLLDAVARAGLLPESLLYGLARHIAAFHAAAARRPDCGGAAAMMALVETNTGILRSRRAARFSKRRIDRIEKAIGGELGRLGPLLDRRRQAGCVRHGHGDLHLRNICLLDGEPVLFDCVEFSEEIATVDVLYDLAFLLMDLDHRGYRGFANLVLNRYLDISRQDDGVAALPLFVALRAIIRAHVSATMAERGWGDRKPWRGFAEARRYLRDAEAALRPHAARLVAIGGFSGTGKSSLAGRLALDLAAGPGARVLRSDVLRKLRFGRQPEQPLPAECYTEEATALVYHELSERAEAALCAGYPVIVDAVALREDERRGFAEVARKNGASLTGLWLDAPAEVLAARLDARLGDASDATETVLRQQLTRDPGDLDGWIRIDAGGDAGSTLAAARRALNG